MTLRDLHAENDEACCADIDPFVSDVSAKHRTRDGRIIEVVAFSRWLDYEAHRRC